MCEFMTGAQTELKYWYFLIPPERESFFKDSVILRSLAGLHNSRRINHIFLSGEYKAVETYCEGCRIKNTKVSSAREAVSLVLDRALDRAFANDYRRVVCVTGERRLGEIKSDLEKHDYTVEIREF